MKSFISFLQQFAIVMALFFGISPRLVNIIATDYGMPYVLWYCWILALLGTPIFLVLIWYLKSSWNVKHRGYLIASGFAGLVGVLVGWSSLAFLYGILNIEFSRIMVQASFFAMAGILYGFVIEWVVKPLKGETGG